MRLSGPSGAGKSTIFNLIPRLYDVSSGAVKIDGQDVRDPTVASVRAAIAFVSQEPALFNDTVRANIAPRPPRRIARRNRGRRARRRRARFHHCRCRKATTRLSGIVAAISPAASASASRSRARSCAMRRSCCSTKRPARSTPRAKRRCRTALKRLSRGRTVLVIAHRLATVRDADRILALENGRVVEMGRHDDLVGEGRPLCSIKQASVRGRQELIDEAPASHHDCVRYFLVTAVTADSVQAF